MRNGPVLCVFMGGTLTYPIRPGTGRCKSPFWGSDLVRAIDHAIGFANARAAGSRPD
jgi:hypothetical protein